MTQTEPPPLIKKPEPPFWTRPIGLRTCILMAACLLYILISTTPPKSDILYLREVLLLTAFLLGYWILRVGFQFCLLLLEGVNEPNPLNCAWPLWILFGAALGFPWYVGFEIPPVLLWSLVVVIAEVFLFCTRKGNCHPWRQTILILSRASIPIIILHTAILLSKYDIPFKAAFAYSKPDLETFAQEVLAHPDQYPTLTPKTWAHKNERRVGLYNVSDADIIADGKAMRCNLYSLGNRGGLAYFPTITPEDIPPERNVHYTHIEGPWYTYRISRSGT